MPELLEQTPSELSTLPVVIGGELTDYFDSPDLLEKAPVPSTESSAALAIAETVGVNSTSDPSERPSFRDRLFRSRLGRTALAAVAGLGFAAGTSAVDAAPAEASDTKMYTTTDDVWLHADPGLGDKGDLIKIMPKGTRFTADCYVNDTPIGERGNPAWLHGTDETGATGYFTDYYSSSHWSSGNTLHDQGLAFCGEVTEDTQETADSHDLQPAEKVSIFASYDRYTAANWALGHAMDTPPNAGSCTWFVSNALWKGGIQETDAWNNNVQGVKRDGVRYGTDIAWKTQEFLTYAKGLLYVDYREISFEGDDENHLPDAKLGDIIIYDWSGDGPVDHAAVITGFSDNNPEYPLVSGWSEDGSRANMYRQRGWTWSEKSGHFIQNIQDDKGNYPNAKIKAHLLHIRSEEDLTIR